MLLILLNDIHDKFIHCCSHWLSYREGKQMTLLGAKQSQTYLKAYHICVAEFKRFYLFFFSKSFNLPLVTNLWDQLGLVPEFIACRKGPHSKARAMWRIRTQKQHQFLENISENNLMDTSIFIMAQGYLSLWQEKALYFSFCTLII